MRSRSTAVPFAEAVREVELATGYVVLKDRVGDTQFLLMPTARITGIESPAILAADAPNYWDAAWQARHFVDERAHRDLSREAISLAINSESGARRTSCTSTSTACVSTCRRRCANTRLRSAPAGRHFRLSSAATTTWRCASTSRTSSTPIPSFCSPTACQAHARTWRITRWFSWALPMASYCWPARRRHHQPRLRRGVAGPCMRRGALNLGDPMQLGFNLPISGPTSSHAASPASRRKARRWVTTT